MRLFNGKKVAQKILKELGQSIKREKLRPVLSVILVGDDEASKLYLKLKKETAKKVGIEVQEFLFDNQIKEEEIIKKIKELNQDSQVSGLIAQLPLPAIFNTDNIISAIDPAKDVDGFHQENRRLLEKDKQPYFLPVLPSAILIAISAAFNNKLERAKDKKILALVNSEIFGKALKLVFARKGLELNYLARNTCIVLGAEKEINSADVLITACGCPNLIKEGMIKERTVLIDAGITRYFDGRVAGDIDRESVKDKASFLTPVPGGIGPLTVVLLLRNVYLAVGGS